MSILTTDADLADLLASTRSVAVVGMSPRTTRASNDVARSVMAHTDWTVWFVNPNETEILGQTVYPSLADLPATPDMVNVFRNRHELGGVTAEAIAVDARSLWFQLDLIDHEAATRAAEAGLDVVQDLCLKIELARFSQRLSP